MNFEEFLHKIDQKLDKVIEDVTDIKVTQAKQGVVQIKQEENLKDHMKRSDTLEDLYAHLKEKEIEPIKAQLHEVKGGYKTLKILGGIAVALAGLLIKFLSH